MKRNTGNKNFLATIFTVLMFVASIAGNFAMLIPAAFAANGIGEVTYLSIDGFVSNIDEGVITVDEEKDIVIKIHNDEPVGGSCIDEIIITFPSAWQGQINTATSSATNFGTVFLSNEKDDGTYSGLTNDPQSLRIVPDYSTDGVQLCPSGITTITLKGLKAPTDPELSTIMIMTSDEGHNEPSDNYVRQPIDILPIIHVTSTEQPVIRYIDFLSVSSGTSPAEYTISSQAKGGWGRLNDLYVNANAAMTVDIYVERASSGLQTGAAGDYLIADDVALVGGINTITMDYTVDGRPVDVIGQMTDGFLKDAEQGGVSRNYYIDIVSGPGNSLQVLGHTDEDADEAIDPTYSGTPYQNPPKEGTVLNVENVMKRKILVQLVKIDEAGREIDVLANGIPIYYTTTLSSFVDASPRLTDTSGQVEIRLNPGTVAGNALVEVCYPDIACTDEDIAIAPGAPQSCQITKGLDTFVEAGSEETIEATIYDQYGNVISNNPSAPLVTFDLISAPDTDADLDDDTNPPFIGDGDGFEQEISQFGIADVSLKTSATMGANVVNVTADGMNCGVTTVTGTLGQADAIDCEVITELPDSELTADQCFDVLMHVVDKNGNPLPKWESIVEFSLHDTSKYIQSTDLREELIFDGGQKVQGKLNNNDPAYATITVCGCDELGTLEFKCKSDTLLKDNQTLDVINSEPSCIDVDVEGRESECDDTMQLHTSVRDTCGNKLVDQECSEGGWASSCVKLQTSNSCAVLSTNKTCVDLRNTGQAPLVDLDISGCGCGDVEITAIDEEDCCPSVYEGALPQCDKVFINKQGPASYISMALYPKAENQDGFYVSEKAVVDLTLKDECDQTVTCGKDEVDLELSGEDCADTSIQVDSPLFVDEGGWCQGQVLCSELTPLGEAKCEETPRTIIDKEIKYCEWTSGRNEGDCTGTPVCSVMQFQQQCLNWGCVWSNGQCGGTPEFQCNDPLSPGAGHNMEVCTQVGCSWTPEYSCKGEVDMEQNCRAYAPDEEQCNLVGEMVPESCEWVDNPCGFKYEPVHKVVVENCANGTKESGDKEWTDLPEEKDLVIDKIAFSYNGPTDHVEACIYEETEEKVGFQPYGDAKDLVWNCMHLDQVPHVPYNDYENENDWGAHDTIHSTGGANDLGVGEIYIMELENRISKYNGNNEYDNQRMGGAIVEPGDTKDFYIVLSSNGAITCGEFDADYLYYEDYSSPDIIGWQPWSSPEPTHVIDTMDDSEDYTRRNDDYTGSDPYPVTMPDTESYGFGDRILHNLIFYNGKAQVFFRDLVAEWVNVHVDSVLPIVLDTSNGMPVFEDDQAKVEFLTQPATQIVVRNHGDLGGSQFICDDAGFEPTIEYDPDEENKCDGKGFGFNGCDHHMMFRDCRPAMACSDEGYDINLQVTDGFQNQVGLETEVQLMGCLEYPHYIYLGDTFLPFGMNTTIDLWEKMGLHDESSDPFDACFDESEFRTIVQEELEERFGPHNQYSDIVGSPEFIDFVHSIFEGKNVKFLDESGSEITETDAAGHLIVKTDSEGKAKVRVVSDDSSMFGMKSFDTSYRLFFVPHALDADYIDVAFAPGAPAAWDILAIPSEGIPADGEQEAKLLIRKTDACGNPVAIDEDVKVTAESESGRAVISRDFSGQNNYDNEVVGDASQWSCYGLFPWFEDCSLTLLDDVIENVTVRVEDATCDGENGESITIMNGDSSDNGGFCTGFPGCDAFDNLYDCEIHECIWDSGTVCQDEDSTIVSFSGAPTKLTITEILHSDLIPADGWKHYDADEINLPYDACGVHEYRECGLYGNEEICSKECVEYGNTGAWVTVQVQDKFGQRVTGYLGDGFEGDPGDVFGIPDNKFEQICIALDDHQAFIEDYTYGFVHLDKETTHHGRIYCGDLAYGQGSFKVVYNMLDHHEQPLDARETKKVIVSVFDACDKESYEQNGGNWLESTWDDVCDAQEYNENNLPDSETASRLDPDANKIIYTAVPDRWDINADKLVVAADGEDYATLVINTENEYFDVRTSMDATVQSSLLGSKLESEAITPGCYVEGTYDPINPTSINVMTEACSGGQAKLKLSSTKEGVARVTVTGNGFGCTEWDIGDPEDGEFEAIPHCEEWGVIPMEPKTIEIEFKQAYQDEISLESGWNFFSVPYELAPINDQWSELGLNTKCSASAMWQESSQSWVAPVPAGTFVKPLEGYWCYAASPADISVTKLNVTGVYLPPVKHIYTGWNDVGLNSPAEKKIEHALISIDSIYTQLLDWLEGKNRFNAYANTGELGGGTVPGTTGTGDMEAGQGYFIRTTDEGDLAGQS